MKSYTIPQRLAIAAGAAATAGALYILLSDAISTGHWSTEHMLTPVIVGITIAAGHLIGSALRSFKPISALGFALLFLIGTGLTVYTSVGRQAATADTEAMQVETSNKALADKQADLARARQRLADAERQVDAETKDGGCPDRRRDGRRSRCSDWVQRAEEVRSHISALEAEVGKLGAPKPVSAKADRFAEVLAIIFDTDRAKAKRALITFEPFAYSLFLELTAIVAFGFGFGHRRNSGNRDEPRKHGATVAATVPATVGNDNPPNGGGNRTVARRAMVATKAAAEAEVIRLVARGEQLPNQDELASRWGVHKGTASKWLADFEQRGIVTRRRDGRSKRVAAA